MNALLRRLAAVTLVPLSLWGAPAFAHPSVVVVGGPRSYAPPPVRVEYRPQIPCERAVWVPGSWAWTAYGWQWTSGYWQQPIVYQPARPVYYGYPIPPPRPAYGYGYERHEEYERHEHDGYREHGYGDHDRGYEGHGYSQGDRPRPPSGYR